MQVILAIKSQHLSQYRAKLFFTEKLKHKSNGKKYQRKRDKG